MSSGISEARSKNDLATTANTCEIVHVRPFIKWVGGKSQLLNEILKLIPKQYGRYFEPFLGGGAVYFGLIANNKESYLCDLNANLVGAYINIRDRLDEITAEARKIEKEFSRVKDGEQYYYKKRDEFNRLDPYSVVVKDKQEILVGSANITGSGLGLFEGANIEAITINPLDVTRLPEIYSIVRESVLVTDKLVERLKEELKRYEGLKEAKKDTDKELEEIEKAIFIQPKMNVLTYDFLFTESPALLLQAIESRDLSDAVTHDLAMLGLNVDTVTVSELKAAFLRSDAYRWQLANIEGEALFGKYSEILHNAVVDDPRPYRKHIKELVANMFNWTAVSSDDFEIRNFGHTKSMIRLAD